MSSDQDRLLPINGEDSAAESGHLAEPAVLWQARIVALGVFLFAVCNVIGAVQAFVFLDGIYFETDPLCVTPTQDVWNLCWAASNNLKDMFQRGALVRATGNGAGTLLLLGFALTHAIVGRTHKLASPSGPAQTTFAVSLVALCCILMTSSFGSGYSYENSPGGLIFLGFRGVAIVCYLAAALRVMAAPGKALQRTELATFAFATAFFSKGAVFESLGEGNVNAATNAANSAASVCAISALVGALISWASFFNLYWSCTCVCFRRQGSTAARVLAWLGLAVGCGVTNAIWWIYNLNADYNNMDQNENQLGYVAFAAGACCFTVSLLWAAFIEYGL